MIAFFPFYQSKNIKFLSLINIQLINIIIKKSVFTKSRESYNHKGLRGIAIFISYYYRGIWQPFTNPIESMVERVL